MLVWLALACGDKEDTGDGFDVPTDTAPEVDDSDEAPTCPELTGLELHHVVDASQIDVLGVLTFYQSWLRSQQVGAVTGLHGGFDDSCLSETASSAGRLELEPVCPGFSGSLVVRFEETGGIGGSSRSYFQDVDLELHGFAVEGTSALLVDPAERRVGVVGPLTVTPPGGSPIVVQPDPVEGVVAYTWVDAYDGESDTPCPQDGEQASSEWVRSLLVGQGEGGRTYEALDCVPDGRLELLTGYEVALDEAPVVSEGAELTTDRGTVSVPLAASGTLTATVQVDPGPGLEITTGDDLSSLAPSLSDLLDACAADTVCSSQMHALDLDASCPGDPPVTHRLRQGSAFFGEAGD